MNNKVLSIIIVLVLVAVGFLLFMGRSVAPTDIEFENDTTNTSTFVEEEEAVPSPSVVEVALSASNFAFSVDTIEAKNGDTVRVTLTNTQGVHDFRVEGLDVGTRVLNAGESETIEFVADEAGTFEYYCSVGTHRQMGMVGTLIVSE